MRISGTVPARWRATVRPSGFTNRSAPRRAADPGLQRELALASQRLSEILSATGDTKEALAQARRSLELLQQSTRSGASNKSVAAADLGRELAASYTRVGDLLSATGDTSGALDHRRRALSVMETVAAIAPDDVATIRQLGVAHSKLGNQLGNPNYPNVGDPAGALVELERAAAVFEKALPAHPTNAVFRRNLAIAHSNIADVLTGVEAAGRRARAPAPGAGGVRGARRRRPRQRRREERRGDQPLEDRRDAGCLRAQHGRRARVRTCARHPPGDGRRRSGERHAEARAGVRLQSSGDDAGKARRPRRLRSRTTRAPSP